MRTHLKCPHFHLRFGHRVEVLLVHSHIGCFSSKGALEKGERTHRGMRVKRVRGRKREGEEGVKGKRKKNGERETSGGEGKTSGGEGKNNKKTGK